MVQSKQKRERERIEPYENGGEQNKGQNKTAKGDNARRVLLPGASHRSAGRSAAGGLHAPLASSRRERFGEGLGYCPPNPRLMIQYAHTEMVCSHGRALLQRLHDRQPLEREARELAHLLGSTVSGPGVVG